MHYTYIDYFITKLKVKINAKVAIASNTYIDYFVTKLKVKINAKVAVASNTTLRLLVFLNIERELLDRFRPFPRVSSIALNT